MKNKYKLFTMLLVFLVILSVGCRVAPQKPDVTDEPPKEQGDLDDRGNVDDDPIIDDDREKRENIPEEDNLIERSEVMADYIVDLHNVDDATVLITNDTVIVGVVPGNDTNGKLTDDMRTQIENVIRTNAQDINNIYITDDLDIFERIDDIEQELMRGRPISRYNQQINNIINRIQENQ